VGKLERGAFQVQPPVLVLTHAENTLVVSGLEPRGDAEHVSRDRPQLPALHFRGRKQAPAGSRAPTLFQEERAVGIEKRNLAAMVHPRHDIAVRDRSLVSVGGGDGVRLLPGKKRPVTVFPHAGAARGADTKPAFSPWLDPEQLVIVPSDQPALLCAHCHRCISSLWFFSP
jgi:hypothetical protein